MQIDRIGVDLAKYVFEIPGVDFDGKTVLRRTLRRTEITTFFANLPPCLVGMEASTVHTFGRRRFLNLVTMSD
jgi:transposase